MWIIAELGHGPAKVECNVDLDNEEVLAVLYKGVDISEVLEPEAFRQILLEAENLIEWQKNNP